MDRIPKTGECYRHFKNKLYQVITVAIHSETGEQMVVYQALYGSFRIYVRPLAMFISEVDHEKYPDATQKYRFERADVMAAENSVPDETLSDPISESAVSISDTITSISNENLLAFLDAKMYREKLEVLKARRGKFSAEELSAVCEALDIGTGAGDKEAQYRAAENFLTMQTKYDGARLR